MGKEPTGANNPAASGDTPPELLADEWANRCLGPLRALSWPDRLVALKEMHDQLRDDFRDFTVFCEVFPQFVRILVERLGNEPVNCLDQAHIYANSADPDHRAMAGAWLKGSKS